MKLSLYFLFYVAMVLELLIFIVDRDDAEERVAMATKTMLEQMTSVDTVKVFGTPGFKLGGNDTTSLAFHTFSLLSDAERASVRYIIKRTYTYDKQVLGSERSDTTAFDGSMRRVKDDLTANVLKKGTATHIAQTASVELTFWRDSLSGDPALSLVHAVPKNNAIALVEGEVRIEVVPVLRRSFPEAFKTNPTVIQFLKEKWNIADVDNYWPACRPGVTTIQFKSTTGMIWTGD
jgi:hypothetical protein